MCFLGMSGGIVFSDFRYSLYVQQLLRISKPMLLDVSSRYIDATTAFHSGEKDMVSSSLQSGANDILR